MDPLHYVRLRSDDTVVDDLRSWSDLKFGEQAVTAEHLATKLYGEGSEQHNAAQFIRLYQSLSRSIDLGEYELAMYDAAKLGILATGFEFGPELQLARLSRAGLTRGNLAKTARAEERKARVISRASEIRQAYPKYSVASIAKIIASEQKVEKDRGQSDDKPLSERQIRRYLTALL
jgi:hypothetical protein